MAQIGTTKRYMIGILGPNIDKATNELKQPDFVAMDIGSFYVGTANKAHLLQGLTGMLTSNAYNFGLVPVIADKCIFYADIDAVPANFVMDNFLRMTAGFFKQFVKNKTESELKFNDILVFKKEGGIKKYHIYIPEKFGITTKAEGKVIWQTINISMGSNICDTSAHSIRIEGFNKWDKDNKRFIANSRYIPTGDAANMSIEDRLNATWLNPRGWNVSMEAGGRRAHVALARDNLNDANDHSDAAGSDQKILHYHRFQQVYQAQIHLFYLMHQMLLYDLHHLNVLLIQLYLPTIRD